MLKTISKPQNSWQLQYNYNLESLNFSSNSFNLVFSLAVSAKIVIMGMTLLFTFHRIYFNSQKSSWYYSWQVFRNSVNWCVFLFFFLFIFFIYFYFFTGGWLTAGLQDSSQYSSRSQQCCSLDGLDSPSNFQFLQSSSPAFSDRSVCTNYNWYHCHFHIPQLLSLSSKFQVLVSVFC